jgi:hypothetical protein
MPVCAKLGLNWLVIRWMSVEGWQLGKARTIRIVPVALASWRSSFAALRKMKALFLLVAFLTIVIAAAEVLLVHEIVSYFPPGSIFVIPAASTVAIAHAVIQALVLMPLAIAVHRFVLLGEVFNARLLLSNIRRYKRFAIYASLLAFILTIPRVQLILEAAMSFDRDEPLPSAFAPIRFAANVLVYAFFAATMALFPAIAVDAEGAGLRNALEESKYDLLRILAAAALGLLPVVIFQLALQYVYEILLIWHEPYYNSWQPVLWQGAVMAIPVVAGAATLAAMASYVYTSYAKTLEHPPKLPEISSAKELDPKG